MAFLNLHTQNNLILKEHFVSARIKLSLKETRSHGHGFLGLFDQITQVGYIQPFPTQYIVHPQIIDHSQNGQNKYSMFYPLYASGEGVFFIDLFNVYGRSISFTAHTVQLNLNPIQQINIYPNWRVNPCLITSTALKSMPEFDDNCNELNLMRKFRDNFVATKYPDYLEMYKGISAALIHRIECRKDSTSYYKMIWKRYLIPCLSKIESFDLEGAFHKYKNMITHLSDELLIEEEDNYFKSIMSNKLFNTFYQNDSYIETHHCSEDDKH